MPSNQRVVPSCRELQARRGSVDNRYAGEFTREFGVYGETWWDEADLDDYLNTPISPGVYPIPSVFYGYAFDSYRPVLKREKPNTFWILEVNYKRAAPEVGSWRFSYDTSGTTVRVYASKEQIARYPGTAKNYAGAIDVKDGEAQGVDVQIPGLRIDVEATIHADYIAAQYVKNLAAITGTTNSLPFFGFEAKELLFLGSSGSIDLPMSGPMQNAKNTSLRFSWLASANVLNLIVGGINVGEKKGHDLLWVDFLPHNDAGTVVSRPKAVYVERIFDATDHIDITQIGKLPSV